VLDDFVSVLLAVIAYSVEQAAERVILLAEQSILSRTAIACIQRFPDVAFEVAE